MDFCYDVIEIKNIKQAYIAIPGVNGITFNDVLANNLNRISLGSDTQIIELLPENIKINNKQRDNKQGVHWNIGISFDVSSQDPNRYAVFNKFHNKSVVIFLLTESKAYMYGNDFEPLRFYISEANPRNHSGLMGYQIKLTGKTTVETKIISIEDFNSGRFLASFLASTL